MSMNDLDVSKALYGGASDEYARLRAGTAQGATYTDADDELQYVSVLLDGEDDARRMRCDVYIKRGDRVKAVCDPTGRYMVYSMASQVKALEDAIDGIDVGVTSVTAEPPLTPHWTKQTGDVSVGLETIEGDGFEAGTYGTTSTTPDFGGSFDVPRFHVDEYGRVDYAVDASVTLPKVNMTAPITNVGTDSAPNIGLAEVSGEGFKAGNYGTFESTSVSWGDKLQIPGVTIDKYGRTTYGVTSEVTLPNSVIKDFGIAYGTVNPAAYDEEVLITFKEGNYPTLEKYANCVGITITRPGSGMLLVGFDSIVSFVDGYDYEAHPFYVDSPNISGWVTACSQNFYFSSMLAPVSMAYAQTGTKVEIQVESSAGNVDLRVTAVYLEI